MAAVQTHTQVPLREQLWQGANQINYKGLTFSCEAKGSYWEVKCQDVTVGGLKRFLLERHIIAELKNQGIIPRGNWVVHKNESSQGNNHLVKKDLQQLYSGCAGESLRALVQKTFSLAEPNCKLSEAKSYQKFVQKAEHHPYGYCPDICCPLTGKLLKSKEAIQLKRTDGTWLTCSRDGVRKMLLNHQPKVKNSVLKLPLSLSSKDIRAVKSGNVDGTVWFKGHDVWFRAKWFH